MKLLLIISFFLMMSPYALLIEIQAENDTIWFRGLDLAIHQRVELDSVRVKHLESGLDTSLIGVNHLVLNNIVPIQENVFSKTKMKIINFPNPFEEKTTVEFDLPYSGKYHIRIFNLLGETVFSKREQFSPGTYQCILDGSSLNSGIYFFSISSGQFSLVQKICKIGKKSSSQIQIQFRRVHSSSELCKTTDEVTNYQMIGFSKEFVNDTILTIPEGGKKYDFLFLRSDHKGFDYFPMEVGNYWEYEGVLLDSIVGKEIIANIEYFQFSRGIPFYTFERGRGISDFEHSLVRKDTNNNIYVRLNLGEEILFYEFSENIFDSNRIEESKMSDYYFTTLSTNDTVIINDSVIFYHCIKIRHNIEVYIGDDEDYWFAPGMGIVQYYGHSTDSYWKLSYANVNGRKIDFD